MRRGAVFGDDGGGGEGLGVFGVAAFAAAGDGGDAFAAGFSGGFADGWGEAFVLPGAGGLVVGEWVWADYGVTRRRKGWDFGDQGNCVLRR